MRRLSRETTTSFSFLALSSTSLKILYGIAWDELWDRWRVAIYMLYALKNEHIGVLDNYIKKVLDNFINFPVRRSWMLIDEISYLVLKDNSTSVLILKKFLPNVTASSIFDSSFDIFHHFTELNWAKWAANHLKNHECF